MVNVIKKSRLFISAASLVVMTFAGHAHADKNRPLLVLAEPESISFGVVVEGQSLPIGLALGDSRSAVNETIDSFEEFGAADLGECNRRETRCTYTAISSVTGEELGNVTVFYRLESGTSSSSDEVRRMTWTFENWTTENGLSLADLATVDEEELRDVYPDARRARVNTAAGVNFNASLKSIVDGVEMSWTVNGRSGDVTSRGAIFPAR